MNVDLIILVGDRREEKHEPASRFQQIPGQNHEVHGKIREFVWLGGRNVGLIISNGLKYQNDIHPQMLKQAHKRSEFRYSMNVAS